MKKVFILALVAFCSTLSMASTADSVKKKNGFTVRHTSMDFGFITPFTLKMALSGSIDQPAGISLPVFSISTNFKKPNKRWTSSMSLAIQTGVTGDYIQEGTGIKESFGATAITLATGSSFNWKDDTYKQIYSGYQVGYTFCQITSENNYPIYLPKFNGLTGQIDLLGFRGLVGDKKHLGYDVAIGAGYKGIFRIGLIEAF